MGETQNFMKIDIDERYKNCFIVWFDNRLEFISTTGKSFNFEYGGYFRRKLSNLHNPEKIWARHRIL